MNTCNSCSAADCKLRCSLCHATYYCDKKCQKKDWGRHKRFCQGFSPPRSIDDFDLVSILGYGNFTEIYHAKEYRTGKEYAIKKVNKQKVNRLQKIADIFMEKHCLNRLKDYDKVITLYECFKDETELYYLMEFVTGGELWSKCKSFGLGDKQARFYFKQVLEAVSYIHSLGIVHRDIKTENIMLTPQHKIKFIDFGTAQDLQHPEVELPGNHMRKKKFPYFVGTPHFMAPECIQNKFSDTKSDVWSLGCLLHYMYTGHPIFQGGSDYIIFTKALNLEYELPEFIPPDAQDLIKSCLKIESQERPDVDELLSQPYVKDAPETYQIPTLFDLSCKTIALQLKDQQLTEEQITDIFNNIHDRVRHPRIEHIEKRLKSYISKEEMSHTQGV